jgi:hypothetical protein
MIQRYVINPSPSWADARDALRISPPDPRIGVVQITEAATCMSANTAYQKVATGNRATLSGQVYVVQSGTTYIVWDPAYKYAPGSGAHYMVFDSDWVFLKGFV